MQRGQQFSSWWNLFNFGEQPRPCNWNGLEQPRQHHRFWTIKIEGDANSVYDGYWKNIKGIAATGANRTVGIGLEPHLLIAAMANMEY